MYEKLLIPTHEYDLDKLREELTTNLRVKWRVDQTDRKKPATTAPQSSGLSKGSDRFFYIVATDWTRPLTMQYKKAGITNDQGERYVEELVHANLVKIYKASTWNRGRKNHFMWPTPLGLKWLKEANARFMEPVGDAAPGPDGTHVWYQHVIARQLTRDGWTVKIEHSLDQKRVDVGAIMDGGKIRHAYEIVNTGSLQKEVSNASKDVADGWQRVIFCIGEPAATEGHVRAKLAGLIEAQLGADFLQVVDFKQLRNMEWVPCPKPRTDS